MASSGLVARPTPSALASSGALLSLSSARACSSRRARTAWSSRADRAATMPAPPWRSTSRRSSSAHISAVASRVWEADPLLCRMTSGGCACSALWSARTRRSAPSRSRSGPPQRRPFARTRLPAKTCSEASSGTRTKMSARSARSADWPCSSSCRTSRSRKTPPRPSRGLRAPWDRCGHPASSHRFPGRGAACGSYPRRSSSRRWRAPPPHRPTDADARR